MQFALAAPEESPRPKGVSLTALAMCAFALPAVPAMEGQFNSQGLGIAYGGLVLALELYGLWNYWKGRNWARVGAILASFLIVVRGVSDVFERDGSPIVLMSHPVFFLRFAGAAFLLYWLNTRPLRAWFKNALAAADLIAEHLAGKLCTAVDQHMAGPTQIWHLAFEHDAEITLNCPWRIVLDENLAFASNSLDNSMPEIPGDEEQPRRLLQNIRVKSVRVAPHTSDLCISFEMGIELQTWSADPQLPQWNYSDSTLTVFADSAGLNWQVIASRVPNEDSAAND